MVEVGVFVVPSAEDPERTVGQVLAAEESGLDLVAIQDHPYQRRFFDTFALLAYVAARTSRIRLAPAVANLPLRPPAMLAKAAASIDVLSGGRFELGLGAGAFWDNIAAMGGPAREPGESVDALEEAIELLRLWWSGQEKVSFDGEHYELREVKPGPPPAHRVGIWLGAYGPRMLRLTGRLADGWLPSLGNLDEESLAARHAAIDEAAKKAGRDPSEVRRLINVGADTEPDRLVRLITDDRFETLILSPDGDDPVGSVRRIGDEVAPRLRESAS
jgi:alkanesulfonate monooxygenase SsuD/methylene tetrahydromethanopterin reductase-like flavin-dependent oxidoreductase (luciferase family)